MKISGTSGYPSVSTSKVQYVDRQKSIANNGMDRHLTWQYHRNRALIRDRIATIEGYYRHSSGVIAH
jgi:hypothetical protein